MDLKKLSKQVTDKAKEVVEQRGGTDSLKKDASQVADALKSKGSMSDKAKKAADAVKKPG